MSHFEIQDSVAFVTGTNKPNGIGRAIVEALLAAGARKVYASARNRAELSELLAQHPGRVEPVVLDVTDRHALSRLGQAYPDVNLVINNAGVFTHTEPLGAFEAAELEIQVNYLAPLAIAQSFAPALSAHGQAQSNGQRRSALVNINSITSLVNFPGGGTYSASKAASHSLTQAQRRQLPDTLVIGVYPGPIATSMAAELPFDKAPPAVVAQALIAALREGIEDVFPDPMAQQLHAQWRSDAKALERQLATPT